MAGYADRILVKGENLSILSNTYDRVECTGNDHFPVILEVQIKDIIGERGGRKTKKTKKSKKLKKLKKLKKNKDKKISSLKLYNNKNRIIVSYFYYYPP